MGAEANEWYLVDDIECGITEASDPIPYIQCCYLLFYASTTVEISGDIL